jgi:hypothetical protein
VQADLLPPERLDLLHASNHIALGNAWMTSQPLAPPPLLVSSTNAHNTCRLLRES